MVTHSDKIKKRKKNKTPVDLGRHNLVLEHRYTNT